MYTEEEIQRLSEEEDKLSEEALLVLLATLHTTLSTLEDELRLFYQKYGHDGVITFADVRKWVSAKNHTRRRLVVNQTVSDVFEVGFNSFGKLFSDHLTNIIMKEAQFFGVEVDVDKILSAVWGNDELNWLQRLNVHKKRWTLKINNDLKISFLKRDSILDVLGNVNNRGESIETILKRLWRTESNAVSSLTRKQIYETLGIKNYKFIHIDGCQCETCTDLDGQIFPVSEYVVGVTANPLHPNCKDITVPVIESE